MMDTGTLNLDYMQLDSGTGYVTGGNADLDQIFNSQYQPSFEDMCDFKLGLTPNGMDIACGNGEQFSNGISGNGASHGSQQYANPAPSFPFQFQQHQIDPSAIMRPVESTSPKSSNQSSVMSQQQEQPDAPKMKRTRQSKKKPLSKAQEEKKREDFLERNRVAASKCRKRKQEQTTSLQDNHSRLQLENGLMMEEIRTLEVEIKRLRAVLAGHRDSGDCLLQTELESGMANIEFTSTLGSVYNSRHNPKISGSAQLLHSPGQDTTMDQTQDYFSRTSNCSETYSPTTMSSTSDHNLEPSYISESKQKRIKVEQMAAQEVYTNTYNTFRQNSIGSDSSKTSDTFDNSDDESHDTSTITTPEIEKRKDNEVTIIGRRNQLRLMENPRSHNLGIIPTPFFGGLHGLQNPADFIAAQ